MSVLLLAILYLYPLKENEKKMDGDNYQTSEFLIYS